MRHLFVAATLAAALPFAGLPSQFEKIAPAAKGRVGVAAHLLESGETASLHGDERFRWGSVGSDLHFTHWNHSPMEKPRRQNQMSKVKIRPPISPRFGLLMRDRKFSRRFSVPQTTALAPLPFANRTITSGKRLESRLHFTHCRTRFLDCPALLDFNVKCEDQTPPSTPYHGCHREPSLAGIRSRVQKPIGPPALDQRLTETSRD